MLSGAMVIEHVRALHLPPDSYVIVGGGSLAAHGIRDTQDIDLVCTESLFERLTQEGWTSTVRPNGKPGLHKGEVEAYLDVNAGEMQPTTEELIGRSVMIDGISFASLEDVRGFKKAYGREKDLIDIELIDNYRKENPQS